MNLTQLEYVLAIAKYGKFSLAAESLFITQPSLSQQITALEQELGVKLFYRTTRSIQITDAGRAFVEQAEGLIRNMEMLRQNMSEYAGLLKGTINIGTITALEAIQFSNLITDFYTAYPQLTINIISNNSISLLEELNNAKIDVAFLAMPEGGSYPDIDFTYIGYDEYCIMVSKDSPLAAKKSIDLQELKDERIILYQPSQSISGICLNACREAGFTPNIICRNSAAPITASLVGAGLGVGFFSQEEAQRFSRSGTVTLKLNKSIRKDIVMAVSTKHEPSRLIQLFTEFVKNWETHSF